MDRFYVLQSGFVTQEATQLVRSEEADLSLKDRLYAGDRRVSDTENYYDEEVEHLFLSWQKDDALIRRFEFRERILKAAIRLFRGRNANIADWISLQMDKRTVGYLHRRFLKDVLASVLLKQPKSTDNYTYHRLLKAGGGSTNLKTGQDSANGELRDFVRKQTTADLTEILCRWTKDTRGFGDLIHTLHVIFGRRTGYAGTSSNTGIEA